MKKPGMIAFDYGHTLLYEPHFDGIRGMQSVFEHVTHNPNGITPQEAFSLSWKLFEEDCALARKAGLEIHNLNMQRLCYEYLELEFDMDGQALEQLFYDAAEPGVLMPGIDKVLNVMKEKEIRSAVISNIGFTAETLYARLERHLPGNPFEFMIASSDYMVRKPNSMLFELALKKAKLPPEEVWFCGDSLRCDVCGSNAVGIFPVWYDSPLDCEYRKEAQPDRPDFAHFYCTHWDEFADLLRQLD